MMFLLTVNISVALAVSPVRITADPQGQSVPAVFGSRVVWQDNRNGNWDIYSYNLDTQREQRLTTDPSPHINPAVYMGKIVWVDYRNGNRNGDIYLYDLTSRSETRITTGVGDPANPDIFADKIVWEDVRNGNKDIFMYDIKKGMESVITIFPSTQRFPKIYGSKIVWQDDRNGNWDIYMYDTDTGNETRITTDSFDHCAPAVFQDKIAWMDNRNGAQNIYLYDIVSKTEKQLSTGLNDQLNPRIYGEKIVWEDLRNGNSDVYYGAVNDSSALYSAVAQGDILTLTYNVTLDAGSVPPPSAFLVEAGSMVLGVENVTISGTNIILKLTHQVAPGDAVTINYSAGATPIRSASGNIPSLSAGKVTNNTPDTEPPAWTAGSRISAANITSTGLTLAWPAAVDNRGVTGYRIYRSGVLTTVLGNVLSVGVNGLSPGTEYNFKVEAGDAGGNWSPTGLNITVKTTGAKDPVAGSPEPGSQPLDLSGSMGILPRPAAGPEPAEATTVTVQMDHGKALDLINQSVSSGSVVQTAVVPVAQTFDKLVVRVPLNLFVTLAERGCRFQIKTRYGSYILPAAEINAGSLGQSGIAPADTVVEIEMTRLKQDQGSQDSRESQESAPQQGFTRLVNPLGVKVEAAQGIKITSIDHFSSYVNLLVPVREDVNQDFTTGVVLHADGTVSPVPTRFAVIEGQKYAMLNFKTNGTYTVISNPKTFSDIKTHWARQAVDSLAAKMVISGVSNNTFAPEKQVTRAQFVTILVRALGGELPAEKAGFKDVQADAWYAGTVYTALKLGIVQGNNDNNFKPNAPVTREEAAVMLVRALSTAGQDTAISSAEAAKLLQSAKTNAPVSTWARQSVAFCLKNGILQGDAQKGLAPTASCTRAQAAELIMKMLGGAELI